MYFENLQLSLVDYLVFVIYTHLEFPFIGTTEFGRFYSAAEEWFW